MAKNRMVSMAQAIAENDIVLLDGGNGQELRRRSATGNKSLWATQVLIERPDLVRQVHEDYISAGAKVITTNTYATVRNRLRDVYLNHRFEELLRLGGALAQEARERSGKEVLIAGSLPPLHGSYRPDLVRPFDEIEPIYREHVEILAPYVDLFVCETMSNGLEGFAAASAAARSGKPLWVAWTLKDDGSGVLRNGETIAEAWSALGDLKVDAALVNCCAPESISAAIPALTQLDAPLSGGYANAFSAIPEGWILKKDGVAVLGKRRDLTPESYIGYVKEWIEAGAKIVGGCCEVGPEHISYIHDNLIACHTTDNHG